LPEAKQIDNDKMTITVFFMGISSLRFNCNLFKNVDCSNH